MRDGWFSNTTLRSESARSVWRARPRRRGATTIFTVAVLIRLDRLAPVALFAVPAIWSSIATVAAFTFHVGEDLPLLPFVAVALALRLASSHGFFGRSLSAA